MEKEERDAREAPRARREIRHGENLAAGNPEMTWGWATPAGRIRAERRAAVIAAGARLGPRVRALEIGCGTGLFTEMFACSGAAISACDISPDLLAMARRRLPEGYVRFIQGRFEDCTFPFPFDAVIGSSVLHHLDCEHALGKIFALLRPGGRLSFAEPNMLNPQIALQKNIPRLKARLGDSPDETAFFPWTMRRMLTAAGFTGIAITPFDWLHPATPPSLVAAVATAGKKLERMPFIRCFAGSLHIRAMRPQREPGKDISGDGS